MKSISLELNTRRTAERAESLCLWRHCEGEETATMTDSHQNPHELFLLYFLFFLLLFPHFILFKNIYRLPSLNFFFFEEAQATISVEQGPNMERIKSEMNPVMLDYKWTFQCKLILFFYLFLF